MAAHLRERRWWVHAPRADSLWIVQPRRGQEGTRQACLGRAAEPRLWSDPHPARAPRRTSHQGCELRGTLGPRSAECLVGKHLASPRRGHERVRTPPSLSPRPDSARVGWRRECPTCQARYFSIGEGRGRIPARWNNPPRIERTKLQPRCCRQSRCTCCHLRNNRLRLRPRWAARR